MKEKIVPTIYILYCLVDILIAVLSSSILFHMIILGAVCLAAGVGLWTKKAWSIYPVAFSGLLTFTVGAATLYSSIGIGGLVSSTQTLIFNLALIIYTIIALGLSIYTLTNRSMMLDSD